MNQIRKIQELNSNELKLNTPTSASWHQDYHDSSYIYIGNLPPPMNEMDILIVFSQYGVPTHLKLMRDRQTGESKKFAFLKYERFESCVLAIDNLNGYRFQANGSNSLPLRVDHVRYSPYVYGDGFDANLEWDEALAEEMQRDFVSVDYQEEEVTKQGDSKGLISDGAGDAVNDEEEDPMAQFLTDMKRNADKDGRNSTLKRTHHSKRHHHRSSDDGRHSHGHSSRSHRESSRSSGKSDEKHGDIDRNDKRRSRDSRHRSDPSGSSSSSHRSIRHRDSKNRPTKDD